ncbi:hypothetical protein OSH11_11540 [Kaistia dalseonensis]|uniref:Uncharacterized protein n=1 Tax=Kaistia dalseonensis TaxID=410840 RepID=A0ABU0H6J8_9HYPH|nr:hypothetical protein [Kaistia dalseonensis]MCX5495342.1 hypothetical protein [Kaistia dalseonensis]MDQ0437928.1 hypothetical protein [Kaistia dalseonensis]
MKEDMADAIVWSADWLWGLPLVVSMLMLHVLGLGLIDEVIMRFVRPRGLRPGSIGNFVQVMTVAILAATLLHGIEASAWAISYRALGAVADSRSAMLYSLNAITAFGHANIYLAPQWQLMGALEALNGIMMFGLTTAFLFAIMQRVWPEGRR